MPIEVLMPALSPTMTEGNLAKWHKNEGDTVAAGDVIAEIETDKATMEVEAVDEGTLGKILVPEGTENVPVNKAIALLLGEGESESDLTSAAEKEPAAEPAAAHGEAAAASGAEASTSVKIPATAAEEPRTSFGDSSQPEPEWTGAWKTEALRDSLRDAMAEEMRNDDRVYLMGEEVADYEGAYKVTVGMLKEFGRRRVVDTPITEQGFAGVGIGAAFFGLRPIVEFMTFNFAMQAIDQIINSAGKKLYMSGGQINCPIVFRGPNGPASRVAAQHSQEYGSWYAHVPGLKVVSPYDGADYKGLLKSAIRDPNPVIFLENELLYGQSFEIPDTDDWTVPIGKAKVCRKGTDVTLVAHSMMVKRALEAAERLSQEEGIEAEVIDLRSLRPFDVDTVVASVKKTNRLVSCEEGWPFAGIGSEIAALCMEHAFDYLDAPVLRVCAKDVPQPYAANLEKLAVPQSDDVVAAAKQVCYRA